MSYQPQYYPPPLLPPNAPGHYIAVAPFDWTYANQQQQQQQLQYQNAVSNMPYSQETPQDYQPVHHCPPDPRLDVAINYLQVLIEQSSEQIAGMRVMQAKFHAMIEAFHHRPAANTMAPEGATENNGAPAVDVKAKTIKEEEVKSAVDSVPAIEPRNEEMVPLEDHKDATIISTLPSSTICKPSDSSRQPSVKKMDDVDQANVIKVEAKKSETRKESEGCKLGKSNLSRPKPQLQLQPQLWTEKDFPRLSTVAQSAPKPSSVKIQPNFSRFKPMPQHSTRKNFSRLQIVTHSVPVPSSTKIQPSLSRFKPLPRPLTGKDFPRQQVITQSVPAPSAKNQANSGNKPNCNKATIPTFDSVKKANVIKEKAKKMKETRSEMKQQKSIKTKSEVQQQKLSDFEPVAPDYWYQPVLDKVKTGDSIDNVVHKIVENSNELTEVKDRTWNKKMKVKQVTMKNSKESEKRAEVSSGVPKPSSPKNDTPCLPDVAQPVPKPQSVENQPGSSPKSSDESKKDHAIDAHQGNEVKGKNKKKKERGKKKSKSNVKSDKREQVQADGQDKLNANGNDAKVKGLDQPTGNPTKHAPQDHIETTIRELLDSIVLDVAQTTVELVNAQNVEPDSNAQQSLSDSAKEPDSSDQQQQQQPKDDETNESIASAVSPSFVAADTSATPLPVPPATAPTTTPPVDNSNEISEYTKKLRSLLLYRRPLLAALHEVKGEPSTSSSLRKTAMLQLFGIIEQHIKVDLVDLYEAEAVLQLMTFSGQLLPYEEAPFIISDELFLSGDPSTASGLLQADVYKPLLDTGMGAFDDLWQTLSGLMVHMAELKSVEGQSRERKEYCFQFVALRKMMQRMMGEKSFKESFALIKRAVDESISAKATSTPSPPNCLLRPMADCPVENEFKRRSLTVEKIVFLSFGPEMYRDYVTTKVKTYQEMRQQLPSVDQIMNTITEEGKHGAMMFLESKTAQGTYTPRTLTPTELTACPDDPNTEIAQLLVEMLHEAYIREMQRFVGPMEAAIEANSDDDICQYLQHIHQVLVGGLKEPLDCLLAYSIYLKKLEAGGYLKTADLNVNASNVEKVDQDDSSTNSTSDKLNDAKTTAKFVDVNQGEPSDSSDPSSRQM